VATGFWGMGNTITCGIGAAGVVTGAVGVVIGGVGCLTGAVGFVGDLCVGDNDG
jgi:hypothetical protein